MINELMAQIRMYLDHEKSPRTAGDDKSRSAMQPEETPNQPVFMAWELASSKDHRPRWFLQNMEVEGTRDQSLAGRLKSHL